MRALRCLFDAPARGPAVLRVSASLTPVSLFCPASGRPWSGPSCSPSPVINKRRLIRPNLQVLAPKSHTRLQPGVAICRSPAKTAPGTTGNANCIIPGFLCPSRLSLSCRISYAGRGGETRPGPAQRRSEGIGESARWAPPQAKTVFRQIRSQFVIEIRVEVSENPKRELGVYD